MRVTLHNLLAAGPATSREIQAATGLNQAAVSRRLRKMGSSVVRQQRGRLVYYALTCDAFGGGDSLLLFAVDAHGNNTKIANIRPLAHGGFYVERTPGLPKVLLGESEDGFYDGLPFFLQDLAPQGFLGRQIARELAAQSPDFPNNPQNWNLSHVGRYLVSNGDDLPGNLKLGEQAHLRIRKKPHGVTAGDYPQLAESILGGDIVGTSAGGEQPKFTAFCSERRSHVIVKFSPKGDDAVARRWRDILITEYHATETLHSVNWPAAEVRLIEGGGRLFLESQRFDRSGEYGRMSMISLQAVDSEFTGIGNGWDRVMDALYRHELVSWQHCYDAVLLWNFGLLINNTDMHLGNLSLSVDGDVFRIRPIYDMCSMGFAPRSGEVMDFQFTPPRINDNLHITNPSTVDDICSVAREFWDRVAADPRISDEFRRFLEGENPMDRVAQ